MSDQAHDPPTREDGGPDSATALLPEIYAELRRLAAARLSREKPGQTLQATALVHEVWLRIAGIHASCTETRSGGRGHGYD